MMIMNTQLLATLDIKLVKHKIKKVAKNLNKSDKIILFIEPYGATISLLKRGLENGYKIIIFTANSELRTVPADIIALSILSFKVDTVNENDVLAIIKLLNEHMIINAVLPGFEYFLPIVATINHYIELPGISVPNIIQLRNKAIMREKLAQANIPIPKYHLVDSIEKMKIAMQKIPFPAICKPVDAAGSVNVKFVNHTPEAIKAATRILESKDVLWGHKISNLVLYEEYISGKEYSVEGIVSHDEVIFFSITEKFVSDEIEFIEIGHIVNPPLSEDLKDRIEKYIIDVISVLRPNHCPFHAEIRVKADGQPILMEIAARLAGDKIGELINLARGVNYFDYIYAAYLGEKKPLTIMRNDYAGIRFFYRPNISHISSISGISKARECAIDELCFYYRMNTPIPEFPKPLRRLCHVMMRGIDYIHIIKTLTDIDAMMKFT